MTDIRSNDILVACSVGDLSWLKKGLANGSDPCSTDGEVSVDKCVLFYGWLASYCCCCCCCCCFLGSKWITFGLQEWETGLFEALVKQQGDEHKCCR